MKGLELKTIYDFLYPKYKINKPIKLIELFAGYGSQALALKYLGVPFTHHKICEWAIPSIIAYCDLHVNNKKEFCSDLTKEQIAYELFTYGVSIDYNKPATLDQLKRMPESKLRLAYNSILNTNNLVNIQNVKGRDLAFNSDDEVIMTYSFPCQDLSLAGKGAGMSKDSGTRSGLLWEVERILIERERENLPLPNVLLMENVPQVISKQNVDDFNKWQLKLEELGYSNYHQLLNAKDYGIPQNRNRCFMVSILGEYSYSFPKKMPLKLKLKDFIEENVDSKYDLNYHKYNIKIVEKYADDTSLIRSGYYKSEFEVFDVRFDEGFRIRKDKICPTICTRNTSSISGIPIFLINNKTRFMTEKEAYRLMGVKDEDYEKVKANQSDSSLYHLAGDSIVVNVLMEIFRQLL